MPRDLCPFHKVCPFRDACRDHGWLCFWLIWLVLLGGVGFVIYTVWTRGLI